MSSGLQECASNSGIPFDPEADQGTAHAGTITSATIRTSASNPRTEMNGTDGIISTDSGGNVLVRIKDGGLFAITLRQEGYPSGCGFNMANTLATVYGAAGGGRISVYSDGHVEYVAGSGLRHLFTGGTINASNLPTSAAGLASGDLWCDTSAGNVIKRV